MDKHYYEPAHGYCSYLCKEHTITVEYVELYGFEGRKAMSFQCDMVEKCPDPNHCPILIDARKN